MLRFFSAVGFGVYKEFAFDLSAFRSRVRPSTLPESRGSVPWVLGSGLQDDRASRAYSEPQKVGTSLSSCP